MCGCLSCAPYLGPNLACNPGMCPDWESNQLSFGSQAGAQSTEPHQPGLIITIFNPHSRTCLLILEREERERNTDPLPLISAPTGDRTSNLGMCPKN